MSVEYPVDIKDSPAASGVRVTVDCTQLTADLAARLSHVLPDGFRAQTRGQRGVILSVSQPDPGGAAPWEISFDVEAIVGDEGLVGGVSAIIEALTDDLEREVGASWPGQGHPHVSISRMGSGHELRIWWGNESDPKWVLEPVTLDAKALEIATDDLT